MLSIQFIAIIIVGGIGTIYGAILGALVVGALPARHRGVLDGSLPFLVDRGRATTGS